MPSDRLSLRLGQLPQDVLAELVARLCSESAALQAAAEACLATHNPVPHWAVERVLLSPDLVPHILGPLVAEDGAAAAVCSQWLAGWEATNESRRRLKQVPFDFPEEHGTFQVPDLEMAGISGGRLVVRAGSEVHILDRSMHVLQTVAGDLQADAGSRWVENLCAADDDSIFFCRGDVSGLRRSSHDGTLAAEYQLEGYGFAFAVLAPGGLLFCAIYEEDDDEEVQDVSVELIALDAQTMQLRHRFGLGLLNHPHMLAVVGDELYVCDTGNHRLQVSSLTGEHRRSIMGEWREPQRLCVAKDRLYLVERVNDGDLSYLDPLASLRGRRILVLSLLGDILQVVTHPTELTAKLLLMCCFEHKLLACYCCRPCSANIPCTATVGLCVRCPTVAVHGVFALQGL